MRPVTTMAGTGVCWVGKVKGKMVQAQARCTKPNQILPQSASQSVSQSVSQSAPTVQSGILSTRVRMTEASSQAVPEVSSKLPRTVDADVVHAPPVFLLSPFFVLRAQSRQLQYPVLYCTMPSPSPSPSCPSNFICALACPSQKQTTPRCLQAPFLFHFNPRWVLVHS
jgi:hypothetical protein